MSAIATGIFKTVAFLKQSGLGVPATAGGSSQLIRRTKSTLDLAKKTYKSAEILVSQQRRDFRHGVRSIAGTISGELSVGTYQKFMESICRQTAQALVSSGAISVVTAAVTTTPQGTFTISAGSYLTMGFKVGDLVTWSGWATTGVPNNAHLMLIVALTATVMTVQTLDGVAIGPKAAGDSVTCVQAGKKTWIPTSGQNRDYYTIEHWFGDIAQSELFTDCVISKMSVKAPPTGMVTVDFDAMGLNLTTAQTEYFTSPVAQSTGGIEASVNGLLMVQGVPVGVVTGFSIDMTGNYSVPGGVVGANVDPDVFPGSIDITGSMTVLFQNAVFRDYFNLETEISICLVLTNTAASTSNPAFVCFNLPRAKAGGASKDDNEKGLTLTMPFTALEQINGGAALSSLDTTISIQDSAFV